jgi:hypothetical protein
MGVTAATGLMIRGSPTTRDPTAEAPARRERER